MNYVVVKALVGGSVAALLCAGLAVAQATGQQGAGADQPAAGAVQPPPEKPAERPAAQSDEQPSESAGQQGEESVEQPAAPSAEQPAEQSASEPAEQPAGQAAGQPGTEPGAQPEAGEAPSGETAGLSADTVVATAGGVPITLGEVIVMRQSLPAQYQQLPDEVLMGALVEQLADQTLLAKAAEADALDQSAAVRTALANQKRAVLANAYLERAVSQRITDEAIQAAYQSQYADAAPVEEAHAAHILVEDEATAKDIKAKLDKDADFAELAAEHGTDGTASRGGDLGWFTYDQMVPQFAKAVFAMQPGEVSGPVQTPFGWHIIKLFEKREQPVPPIDQVRDQIVEELTGQIQQDVLNEVRSGAEITRSTDEIPNSAIRSDDLVSGQANGG